jgi:hypothetical protein
MAHTSRYFVVQLIRGSAAILQRKYLKKLQKNKKAIEIREKRVYIISDFD